MEQINVKAKKWGNSIGIILPNRIVNQEKIRDGTELNIIIKQKRTMNVRELMEFAKEHPLLKLKKSTEQIMREVDKELWPEE